MTIEEKRQRLSELETEKAMLKAEYNKARMELYQATEELKALLTPEEWEEYKKENPDQFIVPDNVIEIKF